MPPPGLSSSEAAKIKDAQKKKAGGDDKKSRAKRTYMDKANPETVEQMVDVVALEKEYFKEGEWKPAWGNVEFDGDACLKNVSKAGKTRDGFFVPAGTILPLGAALPHMTVLKYGGYFPAGTSFQGGVMIPIHARMVNLLPQETKDPRTAAEEGLCVVQ